MFKLAFMGFRHGHIQALYRLAQETPEVAIVAACEEDAETREAVTRSGAVLVTHISFHDMLDRTFCDAVAIGDYYGRRGALAIEALRHGKHVISDKPLCTSLAELALIETLVEEHSLKLGLQLDLRDNGLVIRLRELIRGGAVGEVHGIVFTAEHPLLADKRPAWYFEPGKHGGTLNDIGIHAIDLIPWLTGQPFDRLVAARSWNAFASHAPWMHDAGQFMAMLENGAGILGECSYFAPDAAGYAMPQYWRITVFGRDGVAELALAKKSLTLTRKGDPEPVAQSPAPETPGHYFTAFLAEARGRPLPDALRTADILRATRQALLIQEAGEKGLANVEL